MITWGLISGAMAFIGGPTSFLVMRVLLGAAEAGFFPGVILYLTYWFPADHRAKYRRHLHGGDSGGRADRFAAVGRDSRP